jgi:fatty acid desaturase
MRAHVAKRDQAGGRAADQQRHTEQLPGDEVAFAGELVVGGHTQPAWTKNAPELQFVVLAPMVATRLEHMGQPPFVHEAGSAQHRVIGAPRCGTVQKVADPPNMPPQHKLQLSHLQPWRWLAAAAVDWCVIALTFVLVARIDHPLGYVLAVVPLGSRQQALGALFHDAAHHLFTGKRWHNDVVGNLVAAWPLGLTLGGYRRYHFAHHRHLGTPEDPEMHHKGLLRQWSLPARPTALGWFAADLFGAGLPHLVAAGKLTRPTRVAEALGLVVFWSLVGALSWHLGALWVVVLWVVSIATVFWSGVRLRIWTEHLGSKHTHRIHVPEWVEQFIMPHNIGLHWEHHQHPTVPFYNLGALRRALAPGSIITAETTAPPLVSLRTLANAFRDSDRLPSGQVGCTVQDQTAQAQTAQADAFVPRTGSAAGGKSAWRHLAWTLAFGVGFYALFRPPDLWAHSMLARFGIVAPIASLSVDAAWPSLAPLVNCIPSALWTYALTATLVVIWARPHGEDLRNASSVWLGAALVLAVGWELGQALHHWGGTFSWADLLVSVVAFAAALRYVPRPRVAERPS